YPVMESYPEQCATPDGRTFTRELTDNEGEKPQERKVNLYYYNPNLDTDDSGNILCSEQGIVAVERTINSSRTPIQDAINLLLEGRLTAEEESQDITTEFPLPGFELVGANLNNGLLTLEFSDPQN